MTALRPEREGTDLYGGESPGGHAYEGGYSYEDTGQFAAAVEQLADPLTDPLPGRPPRRPQPPPPDPAPPMDPSVPASPEAYAGEPWFQSYGEPDPSSFAATPYTGAPGAAFSPSPAFPSPASPEQAQPPPDPYPTAAPESFTPSAQVTAPLPVTEPDPGPDPGPAFSPDRAPGPRTESTASPGAGTATATPATGGRAARRKAAQQQARRRRHGGRGRRARTSAAGTGAVAASAASAAPTSRVAARRAARAAKESPGVLITRVVGELFITFGVVMLLFVAYQLWWTNVLAHQAANGAAKDLEKSWEDTKADPREPGAFEPGQGFAIMYIPKLDVKAPIAEGIDKHKVLDKGMLGHYSGELQSAMPWDKQGNFAVAGHRNTHGEPFRYINKLTPGDKIIVETATTYYIYEMTSLLPQTPPSNISVIDPVPAGSGFTKPGRYITLTTCTPEFTSKYRLIVWGKMTEERPRSKGKPDALIG